MKNSCFALLHSRLLFPFAMFRYLHEARPSTREHKRPHDIPPAPVRVGTMRVHHQCQFFARLHATLYPLLPRHRPRSDHGNASACCDFDFTCSLLYLKCLDMEVDVDKSMLRGRTSIWLRHFPPSHGRHDSFPSEISLHCRQSKVKNTKVSSSRFSMSRCFSGTHG